MFPFVSRRVLLRVCRFVASLNMRRLIQATLEWSEVCCQLKKTVRSLQRPESIESLLEQTEAPWI